MACPTPDQESVQLFVGHYVLPESEYHNDGFPVAAKNAILQPRGHGDPLPATRPIRDHTAAARLAGRDPVQQIAAGGIVCQKIAVEIGGHHQPARGDRNPRHHGGCHPTPPADDAGIRVDGRYPAEFPGILVAESVRRAKKYFSLFELGQFRVQFRNSSGPAKVASRKSLRICNLDLDFC